MESDKKIDMDFSKELVAIHGKEYQLYKCMRKCAELINALDEHGHSGVPNDDILEKVADVQTCLKSVVYVLNENGNYNRLLNDKEVRIRQEVTQNFI